MEIYQMRYFSALAAHGHFTRAAESLHISPPTLTIAIKKLESELGVTLVDRSAPSFVLTSAGKLFYLNCVKILDDIDELERSIHEMSTSQSSMTLLLDHSLNCKAFNDRLELFMRNNPDTDVWIKWMDYSSDTLQLGEKANCLALIPESRTSPQLKLHNYRPFELCLVLPKAHSLCSHQKLKLEQLTGFADEILNSNYEALPPLFAEENVTKLTRRLSVNSNEMIKTAVGFGCGIAIVPLEVAENDRDLEIRRFSPAFFCRYCFAHSASHSLTPPMKKLIQFLRNEIRDET